ncbi:MAG: hypothetical protein ACLGI6_04435 [Gammaproteobacteria bacterium]
MHCVSAIRVVTRLFAAILGLCLCFGSAPARADATDALLNQLNKALLGKVDPDAIEMAKFSLAHPFEAGVVYARAGAQDYPFFALAGAAKAAKNQNLPGIGVFTLDKCLVPITSISSVYSKADSFVSEGKSSTTAAVSLGSKYAAEYAKAGTDAMREKLIDELGTAVTYFADINAICVFAFETNLKMERDLHRAASEASQLVRQAYQAFRNMDVMAGAAVLIKLGVGEDMVCTLIDQGVSGGLIGRTPLLGDLAKSTCSGFVGDVIDGIHGFIKGGVGLAEAGVQQVGKVGKAIGCAVWSLIGNGCSSAAPPTGLSNAAAYCSNKGGKKATFTATNQPNDYQVICNDGSMCAVSPAMTACVTAAEKAANLAQKTELAAAEYATKMPQWLQAFDQRWKSQCPDEQCRMGLDWVRLNAKLTVDKAHKDDPAANFFWLSSVPFMLADQQAAAAIQEARYTSLPAKWSAQFVASGNAACQDEACRAGYKFVAWDVRRRIVAQSQTKPRPPYGLVTTPLYAEAENKAAVLLAESAQRASILNMEKTAEASIAWEQQMNQKWGKQCADATCIGEVAKLASEGHKGMAVLQIAKKEASSASIQAEVTAFYEPKFKKAVADALGRVLAHMPPLPIVVGSRPEPLPWLKPVRLERPARPVDALERRTRGGRPVPILKNGSERGG